MRPLYRIRGRPPWYGSGVLVLASASPRRADLLRGAGVGFTVDAVDADERERPGEPPAAYAARVARAKAALALPRHPGAVLLAADTTVWRPGGPPIGKPGDRAEGRWRRQYKTEYKNRWIDNIPPLHIDS